MGRVVIRIPALGQKGDKSVELINFYDEDQGNITIQLDPLLTPSDNAQRYFKRYNKYKNSLAVIHEQLGKTKDEIAYLDNLLQQLSIASMNDIEEIRDELVQQGYLRDRNKKARKRRKMIVQPYISSLRQRELTFWSAKQSAERVCDQSPGIS